MSVRAHACRECGLIFGDEFGAAVCCRSHARHDLRVRQACEVAVAISMFLGWVTEVARLEFLVDVGDSFALGAYDDGLKRGFELGRRARSE